MQFSVGDGLEVGPQRDIGVDRRGEGGAGGDGEGRVVRAETVGAKVMGRTQSSVPSALGVVAAFVQTAVPRVGVVPSLG
jgi:hypothetical protein